MKLTVFYEQLFRACQETQQSLSQIAPALLSHGITGVEIDYADLVQSSFQLVRELSDCGLPISGAYCWFDWGNNPQDTSWREVLKNLQTYNIHHLLINPGRVLKHQDKTLYRDRMLHMLQEVCTHASEYHMEILMEDFDGDEEVYSTAEEVKWFLDRIPQLSCAFDTGNFYYSGQDVLQALPLLIDRTTYVHCKDRSLIPVENAIPRKNLLGEDMYCTSVGSGIIPISAVLKQLLSVGYDGVLAIELFHSANPLKEMYASADYLNRLISTF